MRRRSVALVTAVALGWIPAYGAPKLAEGMVGAGTFQARNVVVVAAQELPRAIDRFPTVIVTKGGSVATIALRCLKVYRSDPMGIGTSPSVEAYMSGRGSDKQTYFLRIADRGASDRAAIGTSPSGGTCGAGNLVLKPVTGNFVGRSSTAKPKPQ